MWESSCSTNTQSTNLQQSFCNDGGCKARILLYLCSARKIYLKGLGRTVLQSQVVKVINKGKPPRMFLLACNLLKIP